MFWVLEGTRYTSKGMPVCPLLSDLDLSVLRRKSIMLDSVKTLSICQSLLIQVGLNKGILGTSLNYTLNLGSRGFAAQPPRSVSMGLHPEPSI